MTRYFFIETRDPFESRRMGFVADTAVALQQSGHSVTVYLIQNGVFAARHNSGAAITQLLQEGVTIVADDFSLAERGIYADDIDNAIQPASIGVLVDAITDKDTKAIWH